MKAVTFALLLLAVGCGGKITQPASQRSGVVFLGDSIFIRWDLNSYFPGKGYIDAGIAGQTTAQILDRMPDTISGRKVCSGDAGVINCQTIAPPRAIVIYAGWNNLFQGSDPQLAINDIQSMLQLCRNAAVQPIIATVYHYDPAYPGGSQFNAPADQINTAVKQMAEDMGVTVIDLEEQFGLESDYTLDGVHPNPSGYSQMTASFSPVLP